MGKERQITIGGYKYAEVYSRLYVESVIGMKWFGVVVDSYTAEVLVGSTQTGNTYGQGKSF
jgi:hypothetical protein